VVFALSYWSTPLLIGCNCQPYPVPAIASSSTLMVVPTSTLTALS
jgi:hypothetical protein